MTGSDPHTCPVSTPGELPKTFQGELDRLRDEIGTVENSIESSKANGDRAKTHQAALKNDANALTRLLAEQEKLKSDADKKLKEARSEVEAHEADVKKDLDDDIEKNLPIAFKKLSDDLTAWQKKVLDDEERLPPLEDTQAKNQKDVDRAQARLLAANKAMLNIPAEIKAHLDSLQKAMALFREAVNAGQSKKAFAMIQEIRRLDSEITKLTGCEEEQRVTKAREAAQALKAAENELNTSSEKLRTHLYSLQLKRRQLADLQKSYSDDLKKLYATEAAH